MLESPEACASPASLPIMIFSVAPLVSAAPADSPITVLLVGPIPWGTNDPDTFNDPVIWASPVNGKVDPPLIPESWEPSPI